MGSELSEGPFGGSVEPKGEQRPLPRIGEVCEEQEREQSVAALRCTQLLLRLQRELPREPCTKPQLVGSAGEAPGQPLRHLQSTPWRLQLVVA